MDNDNYVVTFNPAPVVGVGALDGLRRMSLSEARKVQAWAARIPKKGRIFDAVLLKEV